MNRIVTPSEAVSRGVLSVNGSVMLVMFGLPALVFGSGRLVGFDASSAGNAAAVAFLASWPLAWLSWSLLVPRWRVWAYERVEDLDELKWRGVSAGLIWRDGHFLERTEIRSKQQGQRIRELEAAWEAKRRREP